MKAGVCTWCKCLADGVVVGRMDNGKARRVW